MSERYTKTVKLLKEHYERDETFVRLARRSAELDVSIGLIGGLLVVDNVFGLKMWIPKTGGRFLLTGEDGMDQFGHNDYRVREGESPGYF